MFDLSKDHEKNLNEPKETLFQNCHLNNWKTEHLNNKSDATNNIIKSIIFTCKCKRDVLGYMNC